MRELMPICFNKASPNQRKLMLIVVVSENKKVRFVSISMPQMNTDSSSQVIFLNKNLISQRMLREAAKLKTEDLLGLFLLYSEVGITGSRIIRINKLRSALGSLSIDLEILESKIESAGGTTELDQAGFAVFVRSVIEECERRSHGC